MITLPIWVGVVVCGSCFLVGAAWGMYEAGKQQLRETRHRVRSHRPRLHGQ